MYDPGRFRVQIEEIIIDDARLAGVWGDVLYRINLRATEPKPKDSWRLRVTKYPLSQNGRGTASVQGQGEGRPPRPATMEDAKMLSDRYPIGALREILIPRESYAEDGATWKSRTPHRPTPAGKIQALLDVTCRKPEPGIVVLLGKGVFESSELTMGSGPRFLGGSIDLRTEIDVARGVILLVEEKARLEFTDARSGEPFILDQVRRVRLVESSADDGE